MFSGTPFLNALAKDNVTVQFVDNDRLVTSQKSNFAPRVGFAYSPRDKTVVRAGFGIFYGGLQSERQWQFGGQLPVFEYRQASMRQRALPSNCPSVAAQGVTLQAGLLPATDGGQLQTFISQPGFHSTDPEIKPPYTMTLQPWRAAADHRPTCLLRSPT